MIKARYLRRKFLISPESSQTAALTKGRLSTKEYRVRKDMRQSGSAHPAEHRNEHNISGGLHYSTSTERYRIPAYETIAELPIIRKHTAVHLHLNSLYGQVKHAAKLGSELAFVGNLLPKEVPGVSWAQFSRFIERVAQVELAPSTRVLHL